MPAYYDFVYDVGGASCIFYFDDSEFHAVSDVFVNQVSFDEWVEITSISVTSVDELPTSEYPEEHTLPFDTVVSAEEWNSVNEDIGTLKENIGDLDTALAELHAYAQGLVSGGNS
jgi:hypothetical protein